jgi:hypothetical protein
VRLLALLCVVGTACSGWPCRCRPAAATADRRAPPRASAFFFLEADDTLVPLACYDPREGRILAGDACLLLVGDGARLETDRGQRLGALGQDETVCDPSGATTRVLLAAGAPPASGRSPFPYAVWPAEERARAARPARTGEVPVPAALRARLQAAAQSLAPGTDGPITITQVVPVDVDGDGAREPVISLIAPGTSEDGGDFALSALVVVRGRDLVLLGRSTYERFLVAAVLDLDHDGRSELFVVAHYGEGYSVYVLRLTAAGDLERLGTWTCGV